MSVLCLLFSKDSKIDVSRCMKFAIIHDLAEVVVGDLTPRDGVSDNDKFKLEDNGMK